jgi:hypothetical protein
VSVPSYTGRSVRRFHYRPLPLASLCVVLLWAVACSAESRQVTVEPAFIRGPADAPVTIVEFADYQ